MLQYQKNKLINLLLQFEQNYNDIKQEIDDQVNAMAYAGKYSEASALSFITPIIDRNIQSIKKQLKSL